MSSPPPAGASPATRPRSHFNNWITAIGGVLAIGALFSFALLVWMDFTQHNANPYLGILTYLVAPGFLILGLTLVFLGAWAQRRWASRHATTPDRWQIDFADPRQRRRAAVFGAGALGFVMLSAFGSYQTYHYSESNAFCGQVCHSAMNPEWVTYQRSAHARVDCVQCHVGEGAQWFVKAKINGTHQLVAYALDNYSRPIAAPVKNMRPARDTCEQCHAKERTAANVERVFERFLSDRRNTPYTARMLMHVNKSATGAAGGGAHWHTRDTDRVEYYATDPQRQEIPWIRVTNLADGTARVFRTAEFKGEPPAEGIRVMDCLDCHNRPAHVFPTANDAVEKAMAAGAFGGSLPNIKRVAVQAMTQKEITTTDEAPQRIADFIRGKYTDPAQAADATKAVAAVQQIFATTIFPERKADWRHYPDNIGHKDWAGCFRCHIEKHQASDGAKVRASDCNACHTLVAQGKGAELETLTAKGLVFKHPDGEPDAALTCTDCHTGGIQK